MNEISESEELRAYFEEQVIEPYQEYCRVRETMSSGRSRDLIAGKHAAYALRHFREQLPVELTEDSIIGKCPDYELIRNIADAAKHKSLTRESRLISSVDQLVETNIVTIYRDEQGEYNHATKHVVVNLDDGSERTLLDVLTNVLNFWAEELVTLGVISRAPVVAIPDDNRPVARSDASIQLDLEITAGLRFGAHFQIREYNYETGAWEPKDLTGWEVGGQVRFPPTPIKYTVSLTHKETGKSTSRTVQLNGEQSEGFRSLESEEEQQEYAFSLPIVQEALSEIAEELQRRDT